MQKNSNLNQSVFICSSRFKETGPAFRTRSMNSAAMYTQGTQLPRSSPCQLPIFICRGLQTSLCQGSGPVPSNCLHFILNACIPMTHSGYVNPGQRSSNRNSAGQHDSVRLLFKISRDQTRECSRWRWRCWPCSVSLEKRDVCLNFVFPSVPGRVGPLILPWSLVVPPAGLSGIPPNS